MDVSVNTDTKTATVKQQIIYFNQSNDTLKYIILNDWNNAYSSKDTPLARHFTDQFIKAFHLAKDFERGSTTINTATDKHGYILQWKRPEGHPDVVKIQLNTSLYPGQKTTLNFSYEVKLPNERFTKFGFDDKTGAFNLRDWYLTPARFDNHAFAIYSNENIDDIANASSNYSVSLTIPKDLYLTTDLYSEKKSEEANTATYALTGSGRMGFSIALEPKNSFEIFKYSAAEVSSNIKDSRVSDIQRAVLADNIIKFTEENLGAYPHKKIMVTQADYDRNPVYGLNQLPSFLRPFPDTFIYEMRFLKTYINAYLKNTLKLDPRKDNWIYDAIQMRLIMKYAQENHPDTKMMGDLGTWKILRGYNLFNVSHNEQYAYLSLLMARRNQDQPIGDAKDTFIKFNEQIAGKYKAGLSINYLDDYLGEDIVAKSIEQFYKLNTSEQQTSRDDLESILKSRTNKNIDWFFDDVVATRKLIDYKFGDVDKHKDSLKVTIKNITGTKAPISFYTLKNKEVINKQWLPGFAKDTTFTIAKGNAEKLALNYNEEIPEFNRRNNFKKIKGFLPNNKPYTFTFFQDLEDSDYNQIFYVPSFIYNLYDGFSPGLRIHNKSLLEKPFIFEFEPTYSINTGELIGSFSLMYNQYIRDEEELYNIRYLLSASTYHYTPDASYRKFTPMIQFRFRDPDLRKNRKDFVTIRQVTVNREKSRYIVTDRQNENYSVFNIRYSKAESEITKHYNYNTDLQLANVFGKLSGEVQYRRLFNDNRQVNIRFFAGMFLYRDTASEFFSFGLDRPTDYLFDYGYYGRSETTGFFSRQFIMADGGFKSQLDTRFANQWMTTVNGSFNVWNWVELYGDAGFLKNKHTGPEFVWDSGVRLNLVTDYFELYLPVYSSNGFELSQPQYSEKIRFVVTISPGTLLNLFTRKWF
ncbi:aminopeptidase [Flavobacterium sp. Sd200]|uniref:aminopeptidase n=1 Tax=Flavobacterium sp. Sd200 TaxID=2692211 RepID=UPI001925C16A|nr:aminopeptidase [Flavobacterium sp. Sd200]